MQTVLKKMAIGLIIISGMFLFSCQSGGNIEKEWENFRNAMLLDKDYDLTDILSVVDAPYPDDIAYTFRVVEEFHNAIRSTSWTSLESATYNGQQTKKITVVYEEGLKETYYFADTPDGLRLLGMN